MTKDPLFKEYEMSLLNTVKKAAMKNKDKVAAGVNKATDVIDKKTHGKHSDKLKKVDDAAAKFAGTAKADVAAAAKAAPARADADAETADDVVDDAEVAAADTEN